MSWSRCDPRDACWQGLIVPSREIGTHYAKGCDGTIIYYWGRGWGQRRCNKCKATTEKGHMCMTQEEAEKRKK